jgi:hypothetical protein
VSDEESAFLQSFYRAIEHREPLDWNHPWRVELYADEEIAPIDPIAQLRWGIEWSALESVHLFSGFRGTGKTTELRRLAHELREFCKRQNTQSSLPPPTSWQLMPSGHVSPLSHGRMQLSLKAEQMGSAFPVSGAGQALSSPIQLIEQ